MSLFSTKDKVPYGVKSYVVYKFLCTGCNASYVGETYRHISTRTHEHLETDKSSNIYQHLLKNLQWKSICDENCFSILDSASKKIINKPSETDPIKTNENIRYFKLPFIRKFSKFTENKLQKLVKQFLFSTHLNWCLFFQLKIRFHMV